MIKYLFIVKNPSFDSTVHRAGFVTEEFNAALVAVPTVDEACQVAAEYAAQGLDMIDLCSGFNHDSASKVFEAVGGNIAVSYAGLKIS